MCFRGSEFFLFGVYWASWMFIYMPFIKFDKFSAIVSSYILHFFLSPGTPTMCILVFLMVSHRSLRLCSLFFSFSFFLFLRLDNFHHLQVCWFFLPPAQICLWIPLMKFSFPLLCFSVQFCAPIFFSLGLFLLFPFCSHIFLTFSTSCSSFECL